MAGENGAVEDLFGDKEGNTHYYASKLETPSRSWCKQNGFYKGFQDSQVRMVW